MKVYSLIVTSMAALIAGFIFPQSFRATIFEGLFSGLSGYLVPPVSARKIAQQEMSINEKPANLVFYKTVLSKEQVLSYYRIEAKRLGWIERNDIDLLRVLGGASGAKRHALSGSLILTAFEKRKKQMIVGVYMEHKEETYFAAAKMNTVPNLRQKDREPSSGRSLLMTYPQGHQIFCMKESLPQTKTMFAEIYKVKQVPSETIELFRVKLEASGFYLGHAEVSEGRYSVNFKKIKQSNTFGSACIFDDRNGQSKIIVWGTIQE